MLEPEIEAALNNQFNREQTAAQEYLAMAAYFEQSNLKGFAKFMRKQSDEEAEHAMRLYDHIFNRGGTVGVGSIAKPACDFGSPRAVFQAAYEREKSNTSSIHDLYRLATERNDYATQTMLHWFIDEQVEEEQWCEEAMSLFEVIGDNRSALLMLDNRYAKYAAEGG